MLRVEMWWVAVAVFVVAFMAWNAQPDPMPLLLVYSQPGKWYWLKLQLMKLIIGRRQKKGKQDGAKTDDVRNSQFGSDGKRDVNDLESKHSFDKEKTHSADAVFFDGSDRNGCYFTLALAQRQNDIVNVFFTLRLPDGSLWVAPEQSLNTNVKSTCSSTEWATVSGFRIWCETPMQRWRMAYKGKLRPSPPHTLFTEVGAESPEVLLEEEDAEFDLVWTNFGDYFDFDQECSPHSIAHSLAIEPWSKQLFHKLKATHQTHYEQFGFLSGAVSVGKQKYDMRLTSMRDHTITGYRNWSDIRRYIMMIYHLEDGTCIHTSVICMPETVFSHLEFGYVITPEKRKIAVDRVHFRLADNGEDKQFPSHFSYSFEAGELKYDVQVKIIATSSFKMGLDQACQVNENMCEFAANGMRGWGFAECEYRIKPY